MQVVIDRQMHMPGHFAPLSYKVNPFVKTDFFIFKLDS